MRTDLPGWTTKIDEVSNGVIMVTLQGSFGRKAEITDIATEETIYKAVEYAFGIEKQVSANWTKFLFDLCIMNIPENQIEFQEYHEDAFGSWIIQKGQKRIIYDGKESWFIFREETTEHWNDRVFRSEKDLKYSDIIEVVTAFQL